MTDRIPIPVERGRVSRRAFLAAAGAGTFAGLAGCFAPGEPATTRTTLLVTDAATDDERTPVDAEEVDLGREEHYYFEFSLDGPAEVTYQVDVLRGARIDVFVLTAEAYETMADDEAGFEAVPGSVTEDTYSGTTTLSLDSGDYRLIISNADVLPENA